MAKNGMEVIEIYRFQLETIEEALRLTSRIHNSQTGETSFDRQIRQSKEYVDNALTGNKDKRSKYMW